MLKIPTASSKNFPSREKTDSANHACLTKPSDWSKPCGLAQKLNCLGQNFSHETFCYPSVQVENRRQLQQLQLVQNPRLTKKVLRRNLKIWKRKPWTCKPTVFLFWHGGAVWLRAKQNFGRKSSKKCSHTWQTCAWVCARSVGMSWDFKAKDPDFHKI